MSPRRLPHDSRVPERDVTFFVRVDLFCIDIIDSLRFTKGCTLRLAITIVALDGHVRDMIEEGRSKGTGDDARLTPDALVPVYHHPLMLHILVTRFCRAHLHTERLLAVLTCGRKIESYVLPLDHFDPGTGRIA